ncbi:uncharacterized protein [Hetaerina americana]|uniref:uncharacterized protein n=1 Tax=Hetaerina americana TaxID=62018 RepID=UPI003A7F13D1
MSGDKICDGAPLDPQSANEYKYLIRILKEELDRTKLENEQLRKMADRNSVCRQISIELASVKEKVIELLRRCDELIRGLTLRDPRIRRQMNNVPEVIELDDDSTGDT